MDSKYLTENSDSSDNISDDNITINNKIMIKNKKLDKYVEKNIDYVPLLHIKRYNDNLWLDKTISNIYFDINSDLYISNYDKIQLYYNISDYEIYQKYYYYDSKKLNIYKHPNNIIQKNNDNKAIIYVGIKPNTNRFYLDNIFRKLIDLCLVNKIRDPITGDYLINKNIRINFYNWAKKHS